MPSPTPDLRKGIPNGAVRILGFDPAKTDWFPVDESRDSHHAYRLADSVNIGRRHPQDIAYFVYDHETLLRGPRHLAYESRHCVAVAR